MMAAIRHVRVVEPVRLDIFVKAMMGSERQGATEAFLAANPGLARQGAFMAIDQVVAVPAPPERPATPAVNPWS